VKYARVFSSAAPDILALTFLVRKMWHRRLFLAVIEQSVEGDFHGVCELLKRL